MVCVAATEDFAVLDEESVSATSANVPDIVEVNSLGRTLMKCLRALRKTERSIKGLTPRISFTVWAKRNWVSIACTNFDDVANTVDKRGHIHRSNFRVIQAELSIDIWAHRVDVAAITRTRNEYSVIVTTCNLRNTNVETANLGNIVRYPLLANAKLSKVIILNLNERVERTYCPKCRSLTPSDCYWRLLSVNPLRNS